MNSLGETDYQHCQQQQRPKFRPIIQNKSNTLFHFYSPKKSRPLFTDNMLFAKNNQRGFYKAILPVFMPP
jgi:hypothetical protein